uniref:Uncharacterized protein n=1 Tax=Siphoviridae sp. ctgmM3 TaxID=2827912 RepID=A0A8S5TK94_9CAUD|nr:MAG TPA: hypothetical protein [Siphoviridae sp. ctgmM3]
MKVQKFTYLSDIIRLRRISQYSLTRSKHSLFAFYVFHYRFGSWYNLVVIGRLR